MSEPQPLGWTTFTWPGSPQAPPLTQRFPIYASLPSTAAVADAVLVQRGERYAFMVFDGDHWRKIGDDIELDIDPVEEGT